MASRHADCAGEATAAMGHLAAYHNNTCMCKAPHPGKAALHQDKWVVFCEITGFTEVVTETVTEIVAHP